MSIFEPEETVGVFWHRLVGGVSTYRHYSEAAVRLDEGRRRLGVMFRAFGGSGAVRITEGAASVSGHRLPLLQKVGLGAEKMPQAILDAETLRLPEVLDVFPARADNEALYEWLAAWFAHAGATPMAADPLVADVLRLRAAVAAIRATLVAWPGLRVTYQRLRQATLEVRPRRALSGTEAEIEAAIVSLLGGRRADGGRFLALIEDPHVAIAGLSAPRGYRPFLPVPLWGEVMAGDGLARAEEGDEPGGESVTVDAKRRRASRHESEQSDRGDPLILHRFETIFSVAEMVNVNRKVEDDDEDGARQAADDLPELSIGSNRQRAASRVKMDLDLAPAAVEGEVLSASLTYPEWDFKRQSYRRNHCRVIAGPAAEEGEDWTPDAEMQRRIRQVRRQFEALRPKRQIFYGEPDGEEIDLAAIVRDVAERRAGGAGSERVFTTARANERDLSLAVLMDVSLSTDAWLGGHRVLDVEKSALLALTHGLTACGDEHAIFTFTSRRRTSVSVASVKDYTEPLNAHVIRRIEALRPGQYTRMGAAIRHVAAGLKERPQRHRLLLLLTDGKPNDIDYYEGRYGIEDTRMAIREARKEGIRVFGVTVDEAARDYFPYLFGRGAYAIVPYGERLPAALPAIYRHLTA
ncbi:nitric oxide reductase NorD protein [Rhodopseudomonas julia]|uniref:Nitric oxide reductase NorD protein n=1 Tax=Rhodopseudomonas julia TaxID=200617 RepID=A0ABU0C6D3_9BRAD|nr:VWA domain-containing protein [Rhodopseudomonas julia]MDQ0326088.1 nitric oxide reductase NorD protein [Rhodopseudomonas julia]